jgi:hypothetical protein
MAASSSSREVTAQVNHRRREEIVIIHNFSRLVGFYRTVTVTTHENDYESQKQK